MKRRPCRGPGDHPQADPGISSIAVLVIDDGSTDRTVTVARKHGVRHFVFHARKQGLARSFLDGVNRHWSWARISWSTPTATTSTPRSGIPDLVRPILEGEADIVVATVRRQIGHFSPLKKLLQKLGTWALNLAAAPAFRRGQRFSGLLQGVAPAAEHRDRFSYAMETIIQRATKGCHRQPAVSTNPRRASRAVQVLLGARAQERHGDRALLHHVQAVRDLRDPRRRAAAGRVGSLLALPVLPALLPTPGGHLQSLILARSW